MATSLFAQISFLQFDLCCYFLISDVRRDEKLYFCTRWRRIEVSEQDLCLQIQPFLVQLVSQGGYREWTDALRDL